MKPNPPVNIWSEEVLRTASEGKVITLYRDKLAERLGIQPKERLSLRLVQDKEMLLVSCLLDGGDLTPEQEKIFSAFLAESGIVASLVLPEKPIAS
jgi:hypothetical protein